MLNAIGYLSCAILMGAIIGFVMINMMVGCNDWADPACVTPAEFFSIDR